MNRSTMSPLKQQSTAQYNAESGPLIPTDWIDAPSQRFYAFALYLALMSWRLYDWNTLQDSEEQSLWLFMKWLLVDGTFMFGLPSLRIPWLEWEPQTMLAFFLIHAIVDGMLMFQVGLPVGAGFAAIGRSFWGAYEMAVNEHNVNPQSVMHNDSLILGRQIIHILPEGSAVLNIDREAFCIDGVKTEARLPITINATSPISIDLLRIDLDTQTNETIHLSKSQIKTMHKEASRMLSYSEKPNEPKTLYHAVKQPGLYVLQKVIDETNLEVSRKRLAHTVVVRCPKASVKQPSSNKCKGELSDVEMEVVGTPPLRVKYRKMINKVLIESSFESIQPEDFSSPLSKQDSNALVVPNRVDAEWAKTRQVSVPLSEHLGTAGDWVYSIDEVQDGFGNTIVYSERDQDEQERGRSKKPVNLHQTITVHERPNVNLKGCTPQTPLKIAKRKTAALPVQYGSTGKPITDASYRLEYMFTPDAALTMTG
jgi:nucleoporin POM152